MQSMEPGRAWNQLSVASKLQSLAAIQHKEYFVNNVFTYGSLMFAPVWQAVVSGRYDSAPALLAGYQRFAVSGEEYPAMKPDGENTVVSGVVYFDVSPEDVARLDAFEGEYYLRTTVKVLQDSNPVLAEAYVLRPAFYGIASDQEWDLDGFAREGITRFLAQYKGFE